MKGCLIGDQVLDAILLLQEIFQRYGSSLAMGVTSNLALRIVHHGKWLIR